MNEELKLPICPQCHETKTVLEIKGCLSSIQKT